jgi:uncharacterized protein (DUF952 family)
MDSSVIYHVTTLQEWEEAQDRGLYEGKSLIHEGFLHCCTGDQLDSVIERNFPNQDNIVKLVIDPLRLGSQLKYEEAADGTGEYPHIYGPLNIQAVTEVVMLGPITKED